MSSFYARRDKALVVLSGGQDSTICLFWSIMMFGRENVKAITFDYGQRHAVETQSALKVADIARVPIELVCIPANLLESTSPLTSDSELEQYVSYDAMIHQVENKVEATFVPMRNAMFLTLAFNRAVKLDCSVVVIGVCSEDTANYPDCSVAFVETYHSMAAASLDRRVRLEAPLLMMSKPRALKLARSLGNECWHALAYTHTSYAGEYPPVDKNHANVLRAKAFEVAGEADPLVVRAFNEGKMDLPDTANYDSLRGEQK